MAKTCADCIRALMITFNFLFVLIGLTVVGLGIYLLVSGYTSTANGELSFLAYPCIGLTTLGIIPVFLAVCGCWGALRYNRCCLGLYFTFLLFVFAAEIATGIAGVVYKEYVRDSILNYLESAVNTYKTAGQGKITSLDLIQTNLKCCGFNSWNDYMLKSIPVPASCCAYKGCLVEGVNLAASLPGCKTAAEEIEKQTIIICAIIIALALIQLVGLVFSMILCCAAKDRVYQRSYYHSVHG